MKNKLAVGIYTCLLTPLGMFFCLALHPIFHCSFHLNGQVAFCLKNRGLLIPYGNRIFLTRAVFFLSLFIAGPFEIYCLWAIELNGCPGCLPSNPEFLGCWR